MIDKTSLLNIVRRIRDRKREQHIYPDHALVLDIMALHPTLTLDRIRSLAAELEAEGLMHMGETINSQYCRIIEK